MRNSEVIGGGIEEFSQLKRIQTFPDNQQIFEHT